MNPLMYEQLARTKAADWARVAEQRRLSNLVTRHALPDQQPPTSGSPRVAGRLASWADQMRTIRQALVSGAIRAAAGAVEQEGGAGSGPQVARGASEVRAP